MKAIWVNKNGVMEYHLSGKLYIDSDSRTNPCRPNSRVWGSDPGPILSSIGGATLDISWEPSDEPVPVASPSPPRVYILRRSTTSGRWGLFYWHGQRYTFSLVGALPDIGIVPTLTLFILKGATQADKYELITVAERLGLTYYEE